MKILIATQKPFAPEAVNGIKAIADAVIRQKYWRSIPTRLRSALP